MKLKVKREELLRPLQIVNSVIERRQTLPILANTLLKVGGGRITLVGTDLEVEMVVSATLASSESGEVTLPARKILDICRTLPDNAEITLETEGDQAKLQSGRSRFRLATLPVGDYPSLEDMAVQKTVEVTEGNLKRLIERTHFAMAQQDVRYYLNGLMLEFSDSGIRAVATDGHRLALNECAANASQGESHQIIVPRKGIVELQRLLEDSDGMVTLEVGANHLRIKLRDVSMTSKLIDGRFPDYERVLPAHSNKHLVVDRDLLRDALTRTSILSNEKYRGVRFNIDEGVLRAQAHNPEQEEAEEEIEVEYNGTAIEIGFNAGYVLDALNAVVTQKIQLDLSDPNSSCLITPYQEETISKYVVMPMRL